MPRKTAVDDSIYLDEAEGFLLEHALIPPPRTWPPLPAEPSQAARLTANKKKMVWEDEVRNHPDEQIDVPLKKDHDEDANLERCVICLMALRDRTIVGVCGHEFCFECIGVWANQSRRCPLCSADMAPFLLHNLDDSTPTKFYLPPLPQRKPPSASLPGPSRRLYLPEERSRPQVKEVDGLDIQVERRREIYQYDLYAKHIASNRTTHFKPNPTPRQMSEDSVLIQRATAFMRRELRVWSSIDVEFLTTYILSLLKAIDIRSEPAIRLLAEFLDTPRGPRYPLGAEHFAHELYSFLRSPFKDLMRYDEFVQYDPPPRPASTRSKSRSRSLSRSVSRSPSRSLSPLSSLSPRSRSRPRSRPPRSPRDIHRRDTFVPPQSPKRRWDERDTWLDPEYAAWLEDERGREEARIARRRSGSRRALFPQELNEPRVEKKPVELLPSPPPEVVPLRMDENSMQEGKVGDESTLSIRGAASASRMLLVERLAKAKAEAEAIPNGSPPIPDAHSAEDAATKQSVIRAAVQARLRLRLKLASEKKAFVYNQNESRAQALRSQILEAKARREAEETDAVLRHMDKIDRAREVRRRLMAAKMMAAETESEKRARELKEKLLGEKRVKMLREQLRERKKSIPTNTAIGLR